MNPSKVRLRSTSAVSLNERFSQPTWPMMATFDPTPVLQRNVTRAPQLVLIVKTEPPSPPHPQRVGQPLRRSVWSRLGWQQVTRRRSAFRPRGFWSFRNKYGWRARFTATYRRRGNQHTRPLRQLLRKTKVHKVPAGQTQQSLRVQSSGAAAFRGRGLSRDVPTKKELDAQLDEYMSLSKSRLDKELDEYMSLSRSRLDAQLDEYMSLAGQSEMMWD